VSQLAQERRRAPTRPFPQLTQREFDILTLIAEGLDNQSIARKLVLSPKTVRNHVSNVFAKIQSADRATPSCSPGARGSGPERSVVRRADQGLRRMRRAEEKSRIGGSPTASGLEILNHHAA